jgi:PAS domain S-box-containing protein
VSNGPSNPLEEKRLAALRRYSILDTLPELAFDELARLAAQMGGALRAVIAFVDSQRVWFKSRLHFPPTEMPREATLCHWTVQQSDVLLVPDTLKDPRVRQLPLVLEEPHVRAYCGAPLLTTDGFAIGALELFFDEPRCLPDSIVETIRVLSRQVMTQLELRRHLVQLSRIFEEHRRAEDALKTSEAFFEALVESLPQRIIRKDLLGRFTYASRNFCTELGRSLEEIRGRTDFDFFPTELAQKYAADDQRVIASRQTFETVEEHVRTDGAKGFVQVVKTPLIDPRGQVVGVQGIFWDVTEQRRTEQELAHERDLLRALLDHIPDRIFFKDSLSRFIRCSASMFTSLGFQHPDEVIGRSDFDYYPRDQAQGYFEEEQRIIQTGQPLINKVQQHGDSQGQEVWSAVTKVPIYNHRGLITGIVGLSRDITPLKRSESALRQAEEKYRNIVENSVEGIFQTTPDGHYLSANRSLAQMYGYASAEELISAMTDIQHQLYVDPNRREEFRRLMREKGGVTGFESQIYKRTGEVIWISESARSVCDARGNLLYYEGSVEDITARKLAEQAREAAREAALESARVKAQFLANMSHEFRTPLNAIIGNASVLLAGRLAPEQRELLEPICESAEALNRLINDILDFSKIEAGKLALESTDFDLRDTVEGTTEMLAQAARNQGDELVCWIDRQVPRCVRGDPVRVRQVLMNLLSNAIKFTRRGEVTLRVHRLAEAGTGIRLRFEVRDTGIGISDKAKPIIFQAFTQADGSTTRRFGGTGLGLTISKQIVELMDGRIGFDSVAGRGSTFWFEIVVAPPGIEPPVVAWAGRELLPGRRVMVVDDHRMTAESIADYLGSIGVQPECFTSAEAAVARLQADSATGVLWDALVIDLEMPETDGLSVVEGLRGAEVFNPLRIIALAAPGGRLEPSVMRVHGISACLVKPVKQGRLEEALLAAFKGGAAAGDVAGPAAGGLTPFDRAHTRILLAEDNPVNQQVALRMLKSLGLQADVATNGHEVLAALGREPYEIVLMDCQMPEMDGYETSRRIAELARQDPYPLKSKPFLIAVTANAMAGDREKCLAAGMHDYLSKPLKLADLSRVLERAIVCVQASPATHHTPPDAVRPAAEDVAAMDVSVIQGLRELREPGQPDPLAQLVELFLKDSLPRLEQIESALGAGDASKAAAAAHTLKGSASNLGARHLAALCAGIEKQAKAGDLTAANTVLEPLKGEFQRVQSFLRAEVER